ncbi:MAG: hypothetical protein VYA30_16285 [Myxococcota bacterium]|nr:hypothetical protein [Myxococcota bacterium]
MTDVSRTLVLKAQTVDVYSTLKVTGGIELGTTVTCHLAAAGPMRYTTVSCTCGQKRVAAQMCMESGASAFTWTEFASRSFAGARCRGC